MRAVPLGKSSHLRSQDRGVIGIVPVFPWSALRLSVPYRELNDKAAGDQHAFTVARASVDGSARSEVLFCSR